MKTSDCNRFKATKWLLVALIIVFSVVSFSACSLFEKDNVKSIEVDESSLKGYYELDSFDITTIKLIVTYDDDTTNTINAQNSMLTTEAKSSLTTAGEKNITLTYKKQSTTLTIVLVEDGSTIVTVTFRDSANNVLGTKYALQGQGVDEITPPVVEGQTFSGWVDQSGNLVDLSKVTTSMTITAQYSVSRNTYTVRFVDYKGEELDVRTAQAGTVIRSEDFPKVKSSYPELEDVTWTESGSVTVNSDMTIKMVADLKKFIANIWYARETSPTDKTLISQKQVVYGESVTSELESAKTYLTRQGYQIVTTPTGGKNITSNVDYTFIVKTASVAITVYNDADKNSVVPYDSPVKLGNTITLPTTAASVQNKVLSGWKIQGSKGSVVVSSADGRWTVVNTYGDSVTITPVYSDVTVSVYFEFDFADIHVSNTSDYYKLTLTANHSFSLNDSVSYTFISDLLLNNLVPNAQLYVNQLEGRSVSNSAVYPAGDNGSSERAAAFGSIGDYKILSVTCEGSTISPTGLKVVDKAGLRFIVNISKETVGIEYAAVMGEGDEIEGYSVSGVNGEYITGSNIFLPDTHEDKPVIAIAANAFKGSYSVTGIPAGLKSIGASAFEGASVFGNVNLASLTTLGAGAFKNVNLVSGTITLNTLTDIPESAFEGVRAQDRDGRVAAVTLSFTNAETVGDSAFYQIQGVSAITFGKLAQIGESAFEDSGIATFTGITNVQTVGDKAFKNTKIASIELPKAKEIGALAFADIAELTTVTLSASVTEAEDAYDLDMEVFTNSTAITTLTLGAGIQDLVGANLDTFTVLKNINVATNSTYLFSDQGVLYGKTNATAYYTKYYPNDKTGSYKASIASTVSVTIYSDAFINAVIAVLDIGDINVQDVTTTTDTADRVYAVVVKEALVSAAEAAFPNADVVSNANDAVYGYDVTNKLIYEVVTGENNVKTVTIVKGYSKAESITVPAKEGQYDVTKIGNGAFAGFTELTTLTVNATLDGWNSTILQGDTALQSLTVKAWAKEYEPELSHFEGNNWYDRNNVIALGGVPIGYNNSAMENGVPRTTVTAEQAENAFKTSGIPEEFFAHSNLTEIYLPATITGISAKAFYGCSALKVFEAASITVLGDQAFSTDGSSNKLTEVVLNFSGSGAKMGIGVFEGAINLEKITIKGQVNRNVGSDNLTYYYLPAKTFKGCVELREVEMEYVNALGVDDYDNSQAFYQCISLTEFDFTKLINKEIPKGAFASSGLVYAILTQSTLTSVGWEAFNNSALEFVKFGSTVTNVDGYAFANCTDLVVELSYDNGGFYSSNWEENVHDKAFYGSNETYFISQSISTPTAGTYLFTKTYTSSYPIVEFSLSENTSTSINFDMTSLTNTILIKEEDVVAPSYAGYIFAGWFLSDDENTPADFPLIVSSDTTLYAKYYGEKQGSLDVTKDVKYVYYLSTLPVVEVDGNETATWYLVNDQAQTEIREDDLPVVQEATAADTYTLRLTVRDNSTSKVTYTEEFTDLGVKGYAIIDYSGGNPDRISIPSTGVYNDGANGDADIIIVFAGAFRNCIGKEFTLPVTTIAVLKGYMDMNHSSAYNPGFSFGYKNIEGYHEDYTFGSSLATNPLTTVHIPATVEYIEDGVFALANVEELDFAANSNLLYATKEAFFGSAWWNTKLVEATDNNGFIVAGRLAVAFVGTADTVLLDGSQERVIAQTSNDFGFLETNDPMTMTVRLYLDDGTVLEEEVVLTATKPNDGVYNFAIDVTFEGGRRVTGSFTLNSINTDSWAYTKDSNLFILDSNGYPADAIAISLSSTKDEQVTVPAGTIKLNDGIFTDNADLNTIIINKELVYIGKEAFMNSGLAAVRYGATNNEQYISAIAEVGEDAFSGTSWFGSEKVIIGKIFLKYNNVSGATTLTISEGVTSIQAGAFRGSILKSVTISTTTVKEIGSFAFRNSSLLSITLPNGIQTIGRGLFANSLYLTSADLSATNIKFLPSDTFYNAASLARVQLPNSVKEIGRDAFTKCDKLNVISAEGIETIEVEDGKFICGLSDTSWYKNATTNAGESAEDTVLKLGKVLVKYVIGATAREVFEEAKKTNDDAKLTITIPNTVVTIAYRAFVDETPGSYLDQVTDLVIPNSVVTIGSYAFTGLKGLKRVTFGTGLTEIGAYAFSGLTSLTTAVLPEGLKKIGNGAFLNTKLTTEVTDENGIRTSDAGYTIPSSVTSIGTQAFYGVNTLTVLNLGKKLTEIGANAFATGATGRLYKINWDLDVKDGVAEDGITKTEKPIVTLAKYIKGKDIALNGIFTTASTLSIRFYVEKSVYDYVTSSEFSFAESWAVWKFCEKGDLPEISFSNDGYSLSPIKTEYLVEGDIPVPPHNTVAGKTYTFMYWTIGKEDTATETYERISYPYLVTQEITLCANFYENIVSTESAGQTNRDKNNVSFTYTEQEGEASITGINYAGSIDTLYIPDKISHTTTEAGGQTVQYYYPITGFSFPSSQAANLASIKKLVLTNAANFNEMTDNIFETFPNLEKIELYLSGSEKADYKVVETVLTAKDGTDTYHSTFYVVYSNDVAASAKYGTSLIAVIGNTTAATEEARLNGYDGENNLDFVFEVPEGVTEIFDAAFINAKLKTVALSSTLTTIARHGGDAFGDTLTTLRIPKKNNAANINLTTVSFDSINSNAPIMQAEAGMQPAADGYIEVKSLKYKNGNYGDFYAIGNVLVGYTSSVRSYLGAGNGLVLPTAINGINITVLAGDIYRGYYTTTQEGTRYVPATEAGKLEATEITLPTNVQLINVDAFSNMNFYNVLNAENYANLREVGNKVFDDTNFYLDDTSANGLYVGKVLVRWQTAHDGQNTIKSDTVAIASNAFIGSTITSIVIPSTVKSIGGNAFYGVVGLKEVTISNNVSTIGEGAFMACSSLITVRIDTQASMLKEIGANAFAKDTMLQVLRLPYSVTTIGKSAFSGCTLLKTLTFDGYDEATGTVDRTKLSRLTSLGEEAFLGDTSLTEIKIPSGVTEIGERTFERCSGLTTLEFETGSRLKIIKTSAFAECSKLGSNLDTVEPNLLTVILPDSLVTVEDSVFENCSGLWGIRFGYNIDSLGENVFEGCINLVKIEFLRGTAPSIASNTFGSDITANNYRLRIYVVSEASNAYVKNYVAKWSAVWSDCTYHIYERGDLPTINFKQSESSETMETMRADVLVNPTINFGYGALSSWVYLSMSQNVKGSSAAESITVGSERINASVKSYKSQSKTVEGTTYTFLIVDYDVMTVIPQIAGQE